MSTKITDNYFEYGVHKYFRGNAHLVEIGTYGDKKDPIGAKAYIAPYNEILREHLVKYVRKGEPVSINWSQTTKAELEVNGSVRVYGLKVSAAATYAYEKMTSANLKLFNLSIYEGDLITLLNTNAGGARKYLADEGDDGRIVSEVWVVMEAELAEHFDTSGSIAVSAKELDLNVTAKGGKHGTQTITLSAGSTFAYRLHKVKDWNKGKTRIEPLGLEDDYKGMG